MTDEIKHRQVSETDADSVFAIDKAVYEALKREPLSLSYIKDCIKLYHDTFFIALAIEIIVGFCIGLTSKTSSLGWISAITVSQEYQGRKIGRNLLNTVCMKLKTVGCDAVSLTAEPKLVAYYEKLGFIKVTDEMKDYYGKEQHRFILKRTF